MELLEQLTPLVGIIGAFIAVLKFIGVRTRNEKMREVGNDFRTVVDSLASENEVQRLSAAILLRRFFNPYTESGIAGAPYAQEAIGVIASLLRDMPSNNKLQKLLADGLAHAPDLENADLQHTNLSDAYLGNRVRSDINISGADLFEAILSKASLEGINAEGTVFYLADCSGTKFVGANLTGADFRSANLEGADFEGSRLEGARFAGASGLLPTIAERLDDQSVYRSAPA